MVTRSTADETILQSDRVPVYIGVNRFYLKKGLQSTNRTIDIPNEVIKEQGNELNRGISIQAPQITVSFEDLAVDLDMEQALTESWATLTGSVVSDVSGLISYDSTSGSGVLIHEVGPCDEITKIIMDYGQTYFRVGEGDIIASRIASGTVTVANAANFSVGDSVIIGANNVCTASASATITAISGTHIITNNVADVAAYTTSGYIYIVDDSLRTIGEWAEGGMPNTALKGFEVFSMDAWTPSKTLVASSAMGYQIVAVSGISTDIDSNDMRNSEIDILMLYNDYDDDLIFSRYIQGAAITSIGFNYTADGNATQTYDFQTGKSIDYAGYVNRRSVVASASSTVFNMNYWSGVFSGSEVVDPIVKNTTLNESGDNGKNFLKVVSLTQAGVKKTWSEEASGTASLKTDGYKFVNSTAVITFGGVGIASGTRLEFTYLCDAAYVSSAWAYKFDADEFNHTGTPDAVTGKYQPLTINSNDFDDRVDGIESTSFTLGFTRDYYNAQGIIAQRVKPAQIGEVDGSFTTREGFSKVMTAITSGSYAALTNQQQMDASKSSTYTSANDIPLRVRLYKPSDNTTEIKTVESDAIQVTNINNSNSVGDDSTFEISFLGVKGNLKFSR